MTEEAEITPPDTEAADEEETSQEAARIVTVEDFEAVAFEAVIADVREVECRVLETAFQQSTKAAGEKEPEASVFRLLAQLCGLHFKVKDKAETYGAQLVMGGRRSSVPADWRGEQNDVFDKIYPSIKHPGLTSAARGQSEALVYSTSKAACSTGDESDLAGQFVAGIGRALRAQSGSFGSVGEKVVVPAKDGIGVVVDGRFEVLSPRVIARGE